MSQASENKGTGGLVYSGDRTQSPVDKALIAHLKAIAAKGSGNSGVFAKVGDSITAAQADTNLVARAEFLACFDGVVGGTASWDFNVTMGSRGELAPTIDYFKAVKLASDGTDAFSRVSLAAKVGMAASWAVGGSPSPMDQELSAINPRYAVVMYGSNDIGWFQSSPYDIVAQLDDYETSMRAITDALMARGVIPLLTTMPARPEYADWVPAFTGVVRAIAQGRQVPLIDFNRELMALGPPYGLGSDQIHPTCPDYNLCCDFASSALKAGYPVRNLITLDALDRMRQAFDCADTSFDPAAPRLAGSGSAADPFVIPSVPFGELKDLAASSNVAQAASSCAGAPTTTGPEYVYRLTLASATKLRLTLLDQKRHALRLSVWSSATPGACLVSAASHVARSFAAGTYYVAVDAPSPGVASEYNLAVTECTGTDTTCDVL